VRLKINGEAVDYTLEKESVLSEVVKGVENWLGGSGYLITAIREGGRDLVAAPQREWETTPIDAIGDIDFVVSHAEDVRIEHWVTVRALFGMLEKEIAEPGKSLGDLLAALPEALRGLRRNPHDSSGGETADRLQALLEGQGPEEVRAWPGERTLAVIQLLVRAREELGRRIREASRPKEILRPCLEELRAALGTISEVSVLLQSGKDRQAMETVISFSDLVQRLLAILPFLPPDKERAALFGEINGVLRDLISAFDAKDLVLIGDLFEYEVAPRITKLIPMLERCL
jgi:hypothetical protein